MNTKLALTTLIALIGATTTTFASEYTPVDNGHVMSTLTRAEVLSDTLQARAKNQPAQTEAHVFQAPMAGGLSRAQVVAETLAAIRVGAIGHGERNVFPTEMQLDSIRMAGQAAKAMQVASR